MRRWLSEQACGLRDYAKRLLRHLDAAPPSQRVNWKTSGIICDQHSLMAADDRWDATEPRARTLGSGTRATGLGSGPGSPL